MQQVGKVRGKRRGSTVGECSLQTARKVQRKIHSVSSKDALATHRDSPTRSPRRPVECNPHEGFSFAQFAQHFVIVDGPGTGTTSVALMLSNCEGGLPKPPIPDRTLSHSGKKNPGPLSAGAGVSLINWFATDLERRRRRWAKRNRNERC
jgi:hypothetical protein